MNRKRSTRYFRAGAADPKDPAIAECARLLAEGGLVAFPTETVYGLGACALLPDAVAGIFEAKGRPADNPLIIHADTAERAFELARNVPDTARALADAFWPGPLTMVLPKAAKVPLQATAGLDTVAVRVPAHGVALALLAAVGAPVAAPSANLSGRPSPTKADHVLRDLEGRIDAVLDGGPTGIGLESTVIDLTSMPPRILRPGGVTQRELEAVLGRVESLAGPLEGSGNGEGGASVEVRSPGLKYRHYAPKAEAIAVHGSPERIAAAIAALRRERSGKERPGFLVSRETARRAGLPSPDPLVYELGSAGDVEEAARRFYDGLRSLDEAGASVIYIEAFPAEGVGVALRDRLARATEGRRLDAPAGPDAR